MLRLSVERNMNRNKLLELSVSFEKVALAARELEKEWLEMFNELKGQENGTVEARNGCLEGELKIFRAAEDLN